MKTFSCNKQNKAKNYDLSTFISTSFSSRYLFERSCYKINKNKYKLYQYENSNKISKLSAGQNMKKFIRTLIHTAQIFIQNRKLIISRKIAFKHLNLL